MSWPKRIVLALSVLGLLSILAGVGGIMRRPRSYGR